MSDIQSTISEKDLNDSISEKLTRMVPDLISQIKQEIMNESKIFEPKMEEKPSAVTHRHVTCDGCQVYPILGARYKCAVCADFDLCENCEATSTHVHPFLKIKSPEQTPLKIFVVLKDEEDSAEFNGHNIPLPGLSEGMNLLQGFLGGVEGGCPRNRNPERCAKSFKKCRKIFAEGAKKFMDYQETCNKAQQEKQTGEKTKVEVKVEEPKIEVKVEEVPEVVKVDDKDQPIIVE